MKILRIVSTFLLVSMIMNSVNAQSSDDIKIKVIKLSDKAAVFKAGENPNCPNVSVIASKKGLIVIDTFISFTIAKKIREAIVKHFGRDDFAYVINTHYHFDHSNGNQVFSDAKIIGHDRVVDGMHRFYENKDSFIESRRKFNARLEKALKDMESGSDKAVQYRDIIMYNKTMEKELNSGFISTPAVLTFSDRMDVNMGDMTVKMVYLGPAHTDSDIFIYIPEEGLIFTGDTFPGGGTALPTYNSELDVPRWIDVLNSVLDEMKDAKNVVEGHRLGTYDKLSEKRDYVSLLWQKVNKTKMEDLNLEAAQEKLALGKEFSHFKSIDAESEEHQQLHKSNIEAFYNQLKEPAAKVIEKLIDESGIEKAQEKFKEMRSALKYKYSFDEEGFNVLGNSLLQSNKYREGINVLSMNTEMFPESWKTWDNLGKAYMWAGMDDKAMSNYSKALELNPENESSTLAVSRLKGRVFDKNSETKEPFKYTPGENTGLKGKYLGQKPPGDEPELFAPGLVSTAGVLEFACSFSPDGKELYFNRSGDVMVCRLEKNGWTAPEPAPFNTENLDHEVHITPDGKKLFWGSGRPRPGVEGGSYGIWIMEKSGSGWGEPVFHGPGMYVTTAKNGNLYVTDISSYPGGIVMYRYDGTKYLEKEQLGGGVNSPAGGVHPCIAPDERFIIFDSSRMGGQGGEGDLYICFRKKDGSWGDAVNLGDKINTPGTNFCASLSPDGKYMFYSMKKDVYWVSTKFLKDKNK